MMVEMSDDVVGELLSAFLKLGALQLHLGIITTEAMPTFGSRANQSIGALDDLAAAAAPLKASIACLEVMATVVCTLLTLPPAMATRIPDDATISFGNSAMSSQSNSPRVT
jgi:hypothetical protein